MQRIFAVVFLCLLVACPASLTASASADTVDVEHPFMLWTADDIKAMKHRVATEAWAKAEVEKLLASDDRYEDEMRLMFRYAVLDDADAGAAMKKELLSLLGAAHPLGASLEFHVLYYDLLHDELTADERSKIEKMFRRYIEYAIKPGGTYDTSVYNNERNYARYDGEAGRYTRTNWLPNIIFPWKQSANLMAMALRDEKLIREVWSTHGSYQWYISEYLGDLGFYSEELSKMGATPGALLIYCIAAKNAGLNELGFGYKPKDGATVKGHIESLLRVTFPRVETGTDRWRYPRITEGDVRPWFPHQFATVEGYWPDGSGGNKTWQAHGAWGGPRRGQSPQWDRGKTEKMHYRLWFEIGHAMWPDVGFDYFLAQMRGPDEAVYTPTLYFGLSPIDPEKADPPAPVCGVYPERGFVMLYADTSKRGYESEAPAVGMRLTSGYAHHVNDSLAICNLYAFNRLIYMNPAPDPGYKFKFSRSVRSHNTVMVDGHIAVDPATSWAKTGSVEPGFTDALTTRHAFEPEVKFAAANTAGRYEGVDETRVLMLTRQYLLDIFRCVDDEGHSYAWIAHTFGQATVEQPGKWKPSKELAEKFISPQLINPRAMPTEGRPWSVTVRQAPAAGMADHRHYSAWWKRDVGVRLHMLGQDGVTAWVSNSQAPYSNNERKPVGKRHVDGVAMLATKWAPSATFVAVHEPFEGKPTLTDVRLIEQTDDAVAVAVSGPGFEDRLMVRFGDKADEAVTIRDGKQAYTFKGWAFVREADGKRVVRGGLIDGE